MGGVGYRVAIPLSTFYRIGEAGDEVTLLTHTHVREDALALFGFLTAGEQALFERLIAVSGVGPEARALDPLRHRGAGPRLRPARERRRAPHAHPRGRQEDRRAAGPRAEGQGAGPRRGRGARAARPAASAKDDLVSALVHLGYSRPEAERGVDRALKQDGDGRFEDLLRRSLRVLSGR